MKPDEPKTKSKPKKLIAWMLRDENGFEEDVYFDKKDAILSKVWFKNDWDEDYKIVKVEIKEI